MIKKTPGPRAPPVNKRPSRKITALSYSLMNYGKTYHYKQGTFVTFARIFGNQSFMHFLLIWKCQIFHRMTITEWSLRGKCNCTKLQKIIHTWTTLTTKQSEKGKVAKIIRSEKTTRRWAHIPWPSSQAGIKTHYFQVELFLSSTNLSFPPSHWHCHWSCWPLFVHPFLSWQVSPSGESPEEKAHQRSPNRSLLHPLSSIV